MLRIANIVRLRSRYTWQTHSPARWLTVCPSQCRDYSTPPIPSQLDHVTDVRVKIGNIGRISLMIHQAPRPEPASPIIIYLGRGVPSIRSLSAEKSINHLATSANATVIFANIGDPKVFPYPIPIHTVCRAYDWVQENLVGNRSKTDDQMTHPRIGVCGELVGGSLAAALALTECHGELPGISAAALGNPIVDWTALYSPEASNETKTTPRVSFTNRRIDRIALDPFEATPQSEITKKDRDLQEKRPMSIESLLKLRRDYFSKVEKYHDPFASPLLFFRTPSSDLPLEDASSQSFDLPLEDAHSRSSDSDPGPEEIVADFFKKRRSLRKYPATFSGLVLPNIRVNVGKESVLKDQGFELVDLMRRSFGRWEIDRPSHSGKDTPQRRFEALDGEGLDLWDEKKLLEIGSWFGDVLRKP